MFIKNLTLDNETNNTVFYSYALSDARKSKLHLAGSCFTRVRT